jgi:L-ribulokinase
MGHKWMWNRGLGGFPGNDFWTAVDPLLDGIADRVPGRFGTSDQVAGQLSEEWATELGLRPGIPIPVGALDAHWDAIGAGCRIGDVVNVVGTSTCVMAISDQVTLIPGLSGVVQGSVHPLKAGYEAGLAACGDLFDSIARRAGSTVAQLAAGLENYRAGQTGLLRLAWDNGDRSVLVNPELSGVTFGLNLSTTAQDELFAIESTGFHTRIILERMESHGVPISRVINGGGIPQRSMPLNRAYANIFNKPVLIPDRDVTSLGSAIFAFLAAGAFKTVEEAQAALCPPYRTVEPEPAEAGRYQELYGMFQALYFELGKSKVLPRLREMARDARAGATGASSA